MINAIGKEGININKDLYVNAKVESQYPVDCNGEKGFIDIFISGDKHCIIFENKINNASDTYNQLPKYYGFCSQKYTVDAIVYLPLSDNKTPDKGTWDGKLLKEIEEKLIVLNAFKYNKINFIDGIMTDMSECLVYGLYVLFNSTIYDKYYRILNGSTQVNSTEINAMPVPDLDIIQEMGRKIIKSKDYSVTSCNLILEAYCG